jgi:hypothetical protein
MKRIAKIYKEHSCRDYRFTSRISGVLRWYFTRRLHVPIKSVEIDVFQRTIRRFENSPPEE